MARYSEIFLKTRPRVDSGDSVNAQLLTRGGYIDQVMAGVFAYLPLGWRVLNKIENIVREEMNTIGTEVLLPAMSPRKLWETTGRDGADVMLEAQGANEASLQKNSSKAILNWSHEDVLTPIAQKVKSSYRDFPFAVYQIQTKFRNEERPKSGLMRGREFRMKDLYSFHASEKDLKEYYEAAKGVYARVFDRMGLGDDTHVVQAGGGDFTKDYSHEFDCVCESGEDTVWHDEENNVYYNDEIAPDKVKAAGKSFTASEVGNIFPLGTKYSEAFNYKFQDANGKEQLVYMGSYGIGTSRVMGVLVEKFHDDKGIIWPEAVAPFQVQLVALKDASKIYDKLNKTGVEVLFDDRENSSAGGKLADADLLGMPYRVVVSEKTGEQIEVKRRGEKEERLMDVGEFLQELEV